MKAKIKATGEIINIADYAKVTLDKCDSWGNPIELGFDEVEILQEPTSAIDWGQDDKHYGGCQDKEIDAYGVCEVANNTLLV